MFSRLRYMLWVSFRLGHLRGWVDGWFPKSVFSLGNGLSSVEAGMGGRTCMLWLLMSLSSLTQLIGPFLTVLWVVSGCLTGLGRHTFAYHSQVRLRFKLAAGLGEPWCRDGSIPQGCPPSVVSLSPCVPRVVVIWKLCLMRSLSFMLIILKCRCGESRCSFWCCLVH